MKTDILLVSIFAIVFAILSWPAYRGIWQWRKEEKQIIRDALDTIAIIDELRSDYGAWVTIVCDIESADKQIEQCSVLVCDEWTEWDERCFIGETVLAALRKALVAKGEATQIGRTVKL